MIHHRTAREVKRFDLFKLIVVIILLLLLLLMCFIWPLQISPVATETEPTTEEQVATDADQETEPATEEPAAAETEQGTAPETEAAAEEVVAPTLDPPPTDLASGDTVTLTGTGQPNSEVEVMVDGELVGTAPVDADGKWSFSLPSLDPGDYSVNVRSLAADGSVAAESPAASLSLPQLEIAPPTFTLPDFSALTAGDEATITGTGEPNSEVEVVVDGEVVGTAPVDADGKWSFSLPTFDPGDYDFSVRSLDADGNVVAEAEPSSFSWPDFGLSLPSLSLPKLSLPSFGALSGGATALNGTGEPGTEVEIVVDGKVVGTAPVDADGNWTFDLPLADPGDYEISFRNVDADGNLLSQSATTLAQITAAGDLEMTVIPTLALAESEVVAGETVMLSGTGTPNSEVEVVVDGEVVGTVPVDAEGNWAFDLSLADAGDYEITVQSATADGAVMATAEAVSLTVTAAEIAEATTEEATAATSEDSGTTAETTGSDETTASTTGEGPLEIIFPADEADVLVGELTVTGLAPTGSDVEVLDGTAVLGTTQTDSTDEWRFTFDVVKGSLQLAARLAGSQVTPTDFVDVRVVETSDTYNCASNPGLDRGAIYLVGTCDTLGTIARQAGVTFVNLIAANPQISNQDLIYPGEPINIPGN